MPVLQALLLHKDASAASPAASPIGSPKSQQKHENSAMVSQNDNNGHSVNVATSTATNYTLPDTLSPNGSATLQTQAQYTTTGYFPASVAGPNQSIYNPTSAPNGTAAYTEYDSYGRLYYSQPPSQVAG
jgi:hypothetical protein